MQLILKAFTTSLYMQKKTKTKTLENCMTLKQKKYHPLIPFIYTVFLKLRLLKIDTID